MPISTLDASSALIIVDLQTGILGVAAVPPIADIVVNAARLATAFRARGLPVVLVRVKGSPGGRTDRGVGGSEIPDAAAVILPELAQQPTDHVVTKLTSGAFTRTDLDAFLRGNGTTQVVVAGVATTNGVESTARQAFEHGYHVTLVTDAMTDGNEDAHRIAVAYTLPRVGETGTTDDILAALSAS